MIAVVPPLDRLLAAKVLVIVVAPEVVKITAPNAVPEPTAPVKVAPPVPLEIVKALAILLPKVAPKPTKLSVVVKVVAAPKVTAPV